MPQWNLLVAKAIVAVLFGIVGGCALGVSMAHDAAQGRSLTMEEYVADFARHKADLESSGMPTVAIIVVMVLMCFGFFGLYELLAIGVAWVLTAVSGNDSDVSPSRGSMV